MSAFAELVAAKDQNEIQQIMADVDKGVNEELEKAIAFIQQKAKKHLDATKPTAAVNFSAYTLADDAYKRFTRDVKEMYKDDLAKYELGVALVNGASWRFYGPRSIQKQLRLIMTDSDN